MKAIHGISAVVVCVTLVQTTFAQDYKPGQAIEYRRFGEWEPGVILRPTSDGKQYIVRMKEAPGGTKGGEEKAFFPADLRVPAGKNTKQPDDGKTKQPDPVIKPTPFKGPLPKGVLDVVPFHDGAGDAKGLLSEEDVLAYARMVFGGGNKQINQANLMGQMFHEKIRDYIKKHGTNFKAPSGGKFDNTLNEQGTKSINIIQAINDNYGAPPKLQDYFGTFQLRTSNRGSTSAKPDTTGKKWLHITDEQHESGRITISADGTYVWQLMGGDPPAKWVRGKWREAKASEMFPTEGGPALWLDHTNGGQEYMVRMDREVGYANWINVGVGPGRSPVHYGRPKAGR